MDNLVSRDEKYILIKEGTGIKDLSLMGTLGLYFKEKFSFSFVILAANHEGHFWPFGIECFINGIQLDFFLLKNRVI